MPAIREAWARRKWLSWCITAYMDTQQAINLAIVRRFAAEGIEFAYPTQTLYVRRGASS